MAVIEQAVSEANFTRRYYEVMRRADKLAAVGRVAIRGSQLEELSSYERRQYDEITSGLAEALSGRVRTHYPFEAVDGRPAARNGEPIEELMLRGLKKDETLAAQDSFYRPFLLERSKHEYDELMEQERMARGETDFNTMVTISPYSEELAVNEVSRQKLIAAAQRPDWKRAMVRVSHWDGQRLHIITRSIDNSDLALLKETIGRSLGYDYRADNSTALLGERIRINSNGTFWQELPDKITDVADEILAERHGGDWLQGRPLNEAEDLQAYVESQSEILEQLIAEGRQLAIGCDNFKDFEKLYDQKVHDYAALLDQRLTRGDKNRIVNIVAASAAAGDIARAEGKTYIMCGHILSSETTDAAAAAQTGFESLMRLAHEPINCRACNKKTTIPIDKLMRGRLKCRHCDYEIEACTGKIYKQPNLKKAQEKNRSQPDFFDALSRDLERYSLEARTRRERSGS